LHSIQSISDSQAWAVGFWNSRSRTKRLWVVRSKYFKQKLEIC